MMHQRRGRPHWMHTLGIKLQIAQANIMQTGAVVASGCDSCKPAWMWRMIRAKQAHCCEIHRQNKCRSHCLLVLWYVLWQWCCVNLLSSISAGQQWCMQVYWCDWSGAHSCARCSPVSLLCMAGTHLSNSCFDPTQFIPLYAHTQCHVPNDRSVSWWKWCLMMFNTDATASLEMGRVDTWESK